MPFDLSAQDLGVLEGELARLGFDLAAYLDANPDLRIFDRDPRRLISHFFSYGYAEGRRLVFQNSALRASPAFAADRPVPPTSSGKDALKVILNQYRFPAPLPLADWANNDLFTLIPIDVEIVHHETKLGDTLTALPFIMHLATTFKTDIHMHGAFIPSVRDLLSGLPVRFDRAPFIGPSLGFKANVADSLRIGTQHDIHMAQAYFTIHNLPVPPMPMALPLAAQPTSLPPGICFHPFSNSDGYRNKTWPAEAWLELIGTCRSRFKDMPIYLIGTRHDNIARFLVDGVTPFVDQKLPAVLHLLRSSHVFVSVLSGIAHLAHFGQVERHVLIYPEAEPQTLARNPRAFVIRNKPWLVSAPDVFAAMSRLMERDSSLPRRRYP